MIRSKWMDPDFRRTPKTGRYCVMCQRDLKRGQRARLVLFRPDDYQAVHADDWEAAQGPTGEGWIIDPIGMDCAARLGMEWSKPA